jgi:hypothetical protein
MPARFAGFRAASKATCSDPIGVLERRGIKNLEVLVRSETQLVSDAELHESIEAVYL